MTGELREPTPEDVFTVAADLFDIDPRDLRESKRAPATAYRWATILACTMATPYSRVSIAKRMHVNYWTVTDWVSRAAGDPKLSAWAKQIAEHVADRFAASSVVVDPTTGTAT